MPLSPGVLSVLGGVSQGLQAQQAQAIDRLRAIYGYMGKVDPATIRAQQLGLDTAANNATRQIDTNAQGQYRDQYGNIIAGGRTDVANIDQQGLDQRSPYLQGDPNGSPVSPYTQSIMQLHDAQAGNYNANANVVDPARAGLYGAQTHQILSLLPQRQSLMIDQGNYLNAGTGLRDTQNSLAPGLANSLNMLRGDQGQGDLMSGQGNLDRGQAAQTTAATGQARLNQLAPLYASEVGVNQARMKSMLTKDPDFAYQTTMFDNINSNVTKVQSNYQAALSQGDSAAAANWNQQLQYLNGQRQQLADTLKARASQNGSGGQQQTLGTPPPGSNPNMPSVNQIQPLQPPVRNMATGTPGQPPQGFVPLPGDRRASCRERVSSPV